VTVFNIGPPGHNAVVLIVPPDEGGMKGVTGPKFDSRSVGSPKITRPLANRLTIPRNFTGETS